jgi:biopolymer transport protein ExbD
MHTGVARRVGLIAALVAAVLYMALGDRPESRILFAIPFFIIFALSLSLLVRGLKGVDRNLLEGTSSAGEGRAFSGPSGPHRRFSRPRRTLALLPYFPLLTIPVLMIMVFEGMILAPLPAKGLHVFASTQHLLKAQSDPAGPLVVSAQRRNGNVRFLVGGNPVPLENLHDALKKELSRRADWVVFVEGDDDLPFQNIVEVIDIANSLHARSVMLTPGMRREAQSRKTAGHR